MAREAKVVDVQNAKDGIIIRPYSSWSATNPPKDPASMLVILLLMRNLKTFNGQQSVLSYSTCSSRTFSAPTEYTNLQHLQLGERSKRRVCQLCDSIVAQMPDSINKSYRGLFVGRAECDVMTSSLVQDCESRGQGLRDSREASARAVQHKKAGGCCAVIAIVISVGDVLRITASLGR